MLAHEIRVTQGIGTWGAKCRCYPILSGISLWWTVISLALEPVNIM